MKSVGFRICKKKQKIWQHLDLDSNSVTSLLTNKDVSLFMRWVELCRTTTTTTAVLQPFVRDYPGEPVQEETLTHPPSWSSSKLYQLLPSTTIHSILLVQITCLAIFLHNLFPCPVWFTSWSGALHLIFHTFLHPIRVFFLQHMPIPSQHGVMQKLCAKLYLTMW